MAGGAIWVDAPTAAALEGGEPDLAVALALEALGGDDPPPAARRTLAAIAQAPGTRAILVGHSNAVRGAALSPDARLALSGSCAALGADEACTEGELLLWDLELGSDPIRLDGHTDWVNDVAFDPDGATALTASADGTLILWDVDSGEVLRQFTGHTDEVTAVAYGPRGETALSGSDDTTLILWDVGSGEVLRRLEGHSGGVTRVAFGSDAPGEVGGDTAVSASDDATLILWDVAAGMPIRTFEGHATAVTDVAVHPDGQRIVSVSDDLSLRVWDLATGRELERQLFGAHPKSVVFTPNGREALVSVKTEIRRWDVERRQEAGRFSGRTVTEDRAGEINSLVVDRDGQFALAARSDATLRLWHVGGDVTARRFGTDGTPMEALDVSADGSRLLSGMATGEIVLWDVPTGEPVARYGDEGLPVAPDCLAFVPGDPAEPEETRAMVCAGDVTMNTSRTSLVLWDLDTGEELTRFDGHVTYARALAISPDGRTALTGSQSLPDNRLGDLLLRDLETGEVIRRFDIAHDVTNIAISADGARALTGSVTDSVAILWDVDTGEEIRRFEAHDFPVLNVAFGPVERTVITASFDGTLIRSDIESGETLNRYVGHEGPVFGLDVSPTGTSLISSSSDGAVVLWDLESGNELRRFDAHTSLVFDVAFGPDGTVAFSGGSDGEIIEWTGLGTSLDELVDWVVAHRYVRPLTCDERETYRLDPTGCDPSDDSPSG